MQLQLSTHGHGGQGVANFVDEGRHAVLQVTRASTQPVGAVRIGQDEDGNFVVNPEEEWLLETPLDLVVSGTEDAILMVEAGANEISEAAILDAAETTAMRP